MPPNSSATPTDIDGWVLGDQLGAGKSAIVYHATRAGQVAALKVFNRELVEKHGRSSQLRRLERELSMVGLHHEHLVTILGGGECPNTGLLYVIMELLEAPSLATVISDVPRDRIWPIIAQIASAAKFLEQRQLVHRDIKPANIALSKDFAYATLLDFGVIRPVGIEDLTDAEQRVFLGTLRYSSPEFILREEEDTADGWRAITFYQLGAVLHDLIMRDRLFGHISEPLPRLVQAVIGDIPSVTASDVPVDLVLLARNCLQKDPRLRLRLVKWGHFEVPLLTQLRIPELKTRIRERRASLGELPSIGGDVEEQLKLVRRRTAEIASSLQTMIRRECVASGLFPPLMITDVPGDRPEAACTAVFFSASPQHGLAIPLQLWVCIEILDSESGAIELSMVAGLSHSFKGGDTVRAPKEVTIFAGVFDEPAVLPIVQEVFYTALDHAQQRQAIAEEAGIEWLQIATPSTEEV